MREHKKHLLEVHVAGISFYQEKVLLLQRSPERRIYPYFWECGGGQVHPGENFEDAVKRQLNKDTKKKNINC